MKPTVLLINLPPRDLERARGELCAAGFDVDVAGSTAEGIERFENTHPDVVMVSGATKGRALCRHLRDTPHGERSKIVLLARSGRRTRGAPSFDASLAAPLDPGELAGMAGRLLSQDRNAMAWTESIDRAVDALQVEGPHNPDALAGDLRRFPAAEVTQILNLSRKTARLMLAREQHRGEIWFIDGQARHAVSGLLTGDEAFYELIGWDTGEFAVDEEPAPSPGNLDGDTMFLVMEGLRRLDEARLAQTDGEPAGPPVEPVGYAALDTQASAAVEPAPVAPTRARASAEPVVGRRSMRPWLALAGATVLPLALAVTLATMRPASPPAAAGEQAPIVHYLLGDDTPVAVELTGSSRLGGGRVTLHVDGVEQFSRELRSPEDGGTQQFAETLSLRPGHRTVVARWSRADDSFGHDASIAVDIDPAGPNRLRLTAGESAERPIVVSLDER